MLVVLGLLLPDRAAHLKKMMLCGIRDGLRGRMGPATFL
jgi:hypothetical protein